MNAIELQKAVRARVKRAAEKRIWEKACELLREFGEYPGYSWSLITASFSATRRGIKFYVDRQSSAHTGRDELTISVNKTTVFDAERVYTMGEHGNEERNIYLTTNRDGILLKKYIPGPWERWLDQIPNTRRSVPKREKRKHKEKLRAETKATHKHERIRPLTDDEKELAENFGVSV